MELSAYLDQQKARKLSKHTLRSYELILRTLNEYKPLETIEKIDLVAFFNQLKGTESSIALYQTIIKKYFQDIGKSDAVLWIKTKKPKETLKSDDILTTDEINNMIDASESHYWKALIAFLFETGCRISEAKALKVKDFQDTDAGMIVNIPTNKTAAGYRKVILPFSSQYIRNLRTFTNMKKDDIVFTLSESITYHTLQEIGKDAGINKPISCHKFRHAQATDLVKRGYNEAIIRKKLGWSPTSSMIARYQHLNDEDVINATLENTGKLPQTAAPRTEIREADKVTLVDAAMQFSKLTEENSELKTQMEKQAAEMETMKRQMELITAAMAARQ